MKRKGKHMLKERNPVVRDTIRNPNRSNKVHGDKFRNVINLSSTIFKHKSYV